MSSPHTTLESVSGPVPDNEAVRRRLAAGAGGLRQRYRDLALAGAVSAAAVFAASRFERPAPPPSSRSNAIVVAASAVSIADGAPQWEVIRLGTAKPASPRWTDPSPASVRVDERRAWRVSAPLGGRVVRVFAELGQMVVAGAPLLTVASPDLASIRADQEHAVVELAAAKAARDRVGAIVRARALPEKDELQAAQRLRQAELAFAATSSRLRSLNVTGDGYGEYVVRAARGGQIAEKTVLPGQLIDTGADGNLMMVADLSRVWVVAELFDSDAIAARPGTRARVTVASAPGTVFDAEVTTVLGVVSPERHSIPVRVELDNSDGRLKPNTRAQMQFLVSPPPGSVEVAASALVTNGANQYVMIRQSDGRFFRQLVTAGPAREGVVVITEGLGAGQLIVDRGALLLDNHLNLAD